MRLYRYELWPTSDLKETYLGAFPLIKLLEGKKV